MVVIWVDVPLCFIAKKALGILTFASQWPNYASKREFKIGRVNEALADILNCRTDRF
jgi:hypothetical protein